MIEPTEGVYGGRHRRVLEHPDHRAGINHGTMTIAAITDITPSLTRVEAALDHEGDASRWLVTNPAIRLELPDPEGSSTVSRVYTVRSYREEGERRVIEVDIVRHEGSSPVMLWLSGARIGTSVRILGPRPHFCPPFIEERPALLFADETAIPALVTILRDWPEDRIGLIWAEAPDRRVLNELPFPNGVEIHWLPRAESEPPGSTGRLVDAALEASAAHPEPITVWACGEHQEMRRIRNHFRRDRGMARDEVQVFGYWRRGRTSSQIDEARLQRYEEALALNPRMTVLDDFDVDD
ncbi:siderophore-interacting protein [Microbacterium nymphoidis]|uniref:siderophore-interacting protein n=1 Tax=Microbacterium nymphoidis TaxID=2898586 RepID=UPI001E32209D|nr:siderophore-interacting protein [Microbacterium nymphoidis]MCD2498489.1 siderophore-interacting protein [Microbacterium nymphoidis]